MNIQRIIDGIFQKLYEAFGEECALYRESAGQEFNKPCFLILRLKPSEKRLLGERYQRRCPLDIQYFPGSQEQPNAKMDEVAEQLLDLLEYIKAGEDLTLGRDMHYEIAEGVLHFFVCYHFHVIKQQEAAPAMEALNIEQRSSLEGKKYERNGE